MSDITKKIFSIEPDITDVIKHIDTPETTEDTPIRRAAPKAQKAEDVPDFITRDGAQTAPVSIETAEPLQTRWIMWTGLTLTFVWIAAVFAYFYGVLDLGGKWSNLGPISFAGIALATILPAILITLLWVTWRRLAQVTYQAQRLETLTEKLTRADATAMASTKSLADGIKAELAGVDARLAETVDRFTTLQVDLTAEKRAIDETAITLTQRSEDVGRNLTLQRQALESVSGTFDSKMETLTAAIERQSQTLSKVSAEAEEKIQSANSALAATSETVSQSGESIGGQLNGAAETLSASQNQIVSMNTQLSEMISRLQEEQTKLQTEMNAQVQEIATATKTAQESSELLMSSLRSGQDTVAALNTASLTTNEVQESLSETRKDLAKLETDMLALKAKLRNARTESEALELDLEEPQPRGVGRLRLKPLETDFPPVEPPRATPRNQPDLMPDTLPTDTLPTDTLPDEPLNLGADMTIDSPDDELTNFTPDILRRPAPAAKGKTFGKAKNKDAKNKGGWHWRDMLGGLDKPDTQDALAPQLTPPHDPTHDGDTIIAALHEFDLAPAAIVDDGTIIEASNAYAETGAGAMQSVVAARLSGPIAHLKDHLNRDPAMMYKFRNFTNNYAGKVGAVSQDAAYLRTEFGSPHGRAFLLCAAALRK